MDGWIKPTAMLGKKNNTKRMCWKHNFYYKIGCHFLYSVIFAFVNCLKKKISSIHFLQSAYTLGPLLQCKHFNVRRLERYLWKLVYATIFFLFLPSISWTLKYVSQNFELIKKKFRVRHLQNSSLQAEILKKITLNFKSALPVRKLCQGTSATSATPVPDLNEQLAQFTIHW